MRALREELRMALSNALLASVLLCFFPQLPSLLIRKAPQVGKDLGRS